MKDKTIKLRIAMIGLGDIALKAYLPIIAHHPNISPILSTRNAEKLALLAKQYRVEECYTDLSELIAAQPDAVMIHSATESHFDIARQCLSAGIACFVDKPLSYCYQECQQLVELARRTHTPLYVGFNRRFAPLISSLSTSLSTSLNSDSINHVRWQKNRVNLPEQARKFIYNDFIHVVDGLRFLAGFSQPLTTESLNVTPFYHQGLLASIHFTYQHNGRLIEGSMNRLSGCSEERVEVFAEQLKVEVNNLTSGIRYSENTATQFGFNDWQSYLYTRGFVDMIDDWLKVVKQGFSTEQQLDDILLSHQLCEQLVKQVEVRLK